MAPVKPRGGRTAAPTRSSDDMWVHDMHDKPHATRSAAPSGPPTAQLLVSNLHYEVTAKDLAAVFGQIGTLVSVPHIRYDRSGRSQGIAVITFETPAEATRARNQLHGVLAKGEPMSIEYKRDVPKPRRNSEPTGTPSLLNRIRDAPKAPLTQRLAKAETAAAKSAKAAAVKASAPAGRGGRGERGGRGGRGGKAPRERKLPKTADDLDAELDAYLSNDKEKPASAAAPKDSNGDVEMS
ncbi:RNA-binding domain-containing protein [Peniophora sp. CONT]|nr:RNA-binding domain-containing protein [Peniophora sp. CONT]